MDKKSKFILGLKRGQDFSKEERHEIVRDYLTSEKKKNEIWYQYTGQQEQHGQLLKWLRQFGYKDILTNNSKLEQEQNEKMLIKENMIILNDLWKDCQNIMDVGKRIYKFNEPEMVKNFTMAHIKKIINHTTSNKAPNKNSEVSKV